TLTADPRSWKGSKPIQFTFRWRRCDKNGGSCADISGATGQSYTLTSADVGNTLRVVVTGQNSGGSSSSTSDPTAVIRAKPASPPPGPAGAIKLPNGQTSIPVTSVSPPDHLLVDQIRYTPTRIHSRNVPLVARFHVMNEHGFVIRDALVYAVGVPFDRLSKAPETVTAVDG